MSTGGGTRALRAIGMVAAVAMLAAGHASAKTYEVTRHNDPQPGACRPNDCSLREAVRAANAHGGKDTIVLPERNPRYELERPNSPPLVDEDASLRGDLDLTGKLTLRHPGKGKATIDAMRIDRVLEVKAPTVVKGIKLTGGGSVSLDPPVPPRTPHRRGNGENGDGGGIASEARLALIRSAVVGNRDASSGGGIDVFPDFGTDPDTPSPLRLIRSVVARNETNDGTGGGIHAYDTPITLVRSKIVGNKSANNSGGMSLSTGSELRMRRTTVARNRAIFDPAGFQLYFSDATVSQSTISGNVATEPSGGSGAGISLTVSELKITNSTVAGNTTPSDGGGVATSGSPGSDVVMNSVTVARNVADSDHDAAGSTGGLFNESDAGDWSVVNSLIALNREGTDPSDCSGTFDSGGGNLIGNATGCTGFEPPDDFLLALGASPKLGQLKLNGGPTQTIALRRGSPAIGKAVKAAAPKRDQRGVKRDNKPDIGAYER